MGGRPRRGTRSRAAQTCPDYLGNGRFYTYDDGSLREAAEKIARMAPELAEARPKVNCLRVGECLAPERLADDWAKGGS